MLPTELLLNSRPFQGATADNATASASVAATLGVRHFLMAIEADYSAAVALVKTITVKVNAVVVFVYRWDFSKGPFSRALPVPIHGDYNQAVSVELEASGTGGTTGRIGGMYAPI